MLLVIKLLDRHGNVSQYMSNRNVYAYGILKWWFDLVNMSSYAGAKWESKEYYEVWNDCELVQMWIKRNTIHKWVSIWNGQLLPDKYEACQ